MFWSKIWLFIVAAVAAVSITIALLLPRPAQRARGQEERERLVVACDMVNILLRSNARVQVEIAGAFARTPAVVGALADASAAAAIDEGKANAVREIAEKTIGAVEGEGVRPDFAILIDSHGRVVARKGLDEAEFGDTVAGRFLVDDALAGYLRDDLWFAGGRLYRVAASPVIKRDPPVGYVGAVVIGNAVDKEFASELVKPLGAKISFYAGSQVTAASSDVVLDRELLDEYGKLAASKSDLAEDCRLVKPFSTRSGPTEYSALVARLPGEARHEDAFFTVFLERGKALGMGATLDAVRKDDLSFGNFPWLLVGVGFLGALGVGLALMILEADRPLRRLSADAVKLAKGQVERLPEDRHGGRMGSLARSVNIQIDKLTREARAARRDLDQLLGPGPEGGGGLGTLDLGGPMPVRPIDTAPKAPPPPSEFRFSDPLPPPELDLSPPRAPGASLPPSVPKPPPPRPKPPVPSSPGLRHPTPAPIAPPAAAAPTRGGAVRSLDDDILTDDSTGVGGPAGFGPAGDANEEAEFRRVYDEFVELKKRCGEPTSGVTFAKFGDKLRKNRDELMAKAGTVGVKFSVYVKDGKAALKATPVKEG